MKNYFIIHGTYGHNKEKARYTTFEDLLKLL